MTGNVGHGQYNATGRARNPHTRLKTEYWKGTKANDGYRNQKVLDNYSKEDVKLTIITEVNAMTDSKTVKFDLRQKYSADFRKYINEIFLREAEKYELPINTANSIKWFENGKIQVTFVDDDATYVGVAKCHPNDAFNPEIGIKLAIGRAAQKMRKPFTPREGQAYCYVDENGVVRGTGFLGSFDSQLKVAMGNCFKTKAQARANVGRMMKRQKRAIELLKTLRDEEDE